MLLREILFSFFLLPPLRIVLLISLLLLASSIGIYATDCAEPTNAVNSIMFSNINNLDVGDSLEYQITDKDGNPATIGIECVASTSGEKATKTHKVYYTGVTINCRFYMKVSNNKVTSVYDDWIMIIGGTYSNDVLTKTTTYGKLSFKVTAVSGLAAAKCWLKGTVTGSGNAINVTWSM